MNRILIYITFISLLFVGCTPSNNSEVVDNHVFTPYEEVDEETDLLADATDEEEEETTISVPITRHEIRIIRQKDEIKQAKLSDANVKELESWWDSLPKPLQSQVKSNEVDIEVVSSITTTNEQSIDPVLNDSQVENTGLTLEQIIGTNAKMKYTVSTRFIEDTNEKEPVSVPDEHATDIRLVKKVPVRLRSFTTDIFFRQNDVTNDNLRSLQYWWTNLPEDIKEKVRSRELALNLTCYTVDDGMDLSDDEQLAENAENFSAIMTDVMNRIIGVYRVDDKELSVAKIKSAIKIEKANAKNAKYPAKQYLKVNIRKNKDYIPTL